MLAGSLSVALHVVVAVLALALAGSRAVAPPRRIAVVAVDIVSPPPPSAPRAPLPAASAPAAGRHRAGALGARARTAPPPTSPRAPTTVSRFAEVTARYEAPAGPASTYRAGETLRGLGQRLHGDGDGDGYGASGAAAGLEVPDAPPSSARDPRPRMPYERWTIPGAEAYAPNQIVVELTIDSTGRVSAVTLISGVVGWLDDRAIELARSFAFDPALDDAGRPVACQYRWTFTIVRS